MLEPEFSAALLHIVASYHVPELQAGIGQTNEKTNKD
jgi:hypothetical protein